MRSFLKNNGLSLAMFGLFALFFAGQSLAGHREYNQEQRDHGRQEVGFRAYLATAHFGEATMENWESEFLQMGLYVILTAFLYQKGSAESKSLTEKNAVDEDPEKNKTKKSPWPVQVGGWVLVLYKHSLSLTLLAFFVAAFLLHAHFGVEAYNQEQAEHGRAAALTLREYLGTSQFWFESFQNWQSEFLSIGVVVVISIYLRQQGSPESKPVAMAHEEQNAA